MKPMFWWGWGKQMLVVKSVIYADDDWWGWYNRIPWPFNNIERSNWLLDLCKGIRKKRSFLGGRSLPNLFAHPPSHTRVFVRFGRTKGEIRVEKGNFRGDLGGFWGGWALFGNQPPYPPTFGKDLPKKRSFLDVSPNADNSLNHRIYLGSRVSGKRFSRGIYVLEISRVC